MEQSKDSDFGVFLVTWIMMMMIIIIIMVMMLSLAGSKDDDAMEAMAVSRG